jgi:hypothetical protein
MRSFESLQGLMQNVPEEAFGTLHQANGRRYGYER